MSRTPQAALAGTPLATVGEQVRTDAGWPLYADAGESGPGQALSLSGGTWFAVATSGRPAGLTCTTSGRAR